MARLEHAMVIGASMAGLSAAGVLAKRARRVTLLEAHPLPPPGQVASIAPQGRAPHLLLTGGRMALETIFPGLTEELFAQGAAEGSARLRRLWGGGYRARPEGPEAEVASPLCSRALLEATTRARVRALENVEWAEGRAEGLLKQAGRVAGVVVSGGREMMADLVVDCGGRGSHASEWLTDLGLETPALETVGVGIRYLGMTRARQADDFGGDLSVFIQNTADQTRFGLAFAVEDDRWQVLVGGYFGDGPPADDEGYLRYAESLPVADIADLIRNRMRIGPFSPYAFQASLRRRYGKLRRLPAGFIPLGDSVASFNPVFGQGMSSAAMQAVALGKALDRRGNTAAMVRAHIARAEQITDAAWRFSTGPDFRYARTTGRRPVGVSLTNRYAELALQAAVDDSGTAAELGRVTGHLGSPSQLFRPGTAWRVLSAALRSSGHRKPVSRIAEPAPHRY